MNRSTEYSPEVRERAVRMVQECRNQYPSQWAAVEFIAPKIGCTPQMLRDWVCKHETPIRPTVLIVEDDPVFLTRFSQAIEESGCFTLMSAVPTFAEACAALASQAPDLLLVDLHLPDGNGIDLIRKVSAGHPHTEVLVVTIFGDEAHVMASLEAGASGYLLKDSLPQELTDTLLEVLAGGSPITPIIARQILNKFRTIPVTSDRLAEAALSLRETEILRHIAKGYSFKEIADLLGISPHTVMAHVKKIYQKLKVNSRGEAAYKANQLGLL